MKIIILNLATDVDDTVLGFTTEWINELSHYFDHIYVLSMKVGKLEVNNNISVFPLKEKSSNSKITLLLNFYKNLFYITRNNNISACFAHMTPKQLLFAFPILKINKIKSLLWYEHSNVNLILRLSSFICDKSVSASSSGFNIKSNKHLITGHGINNKLFYPKKKISFRKKFKEIVYVGRISKIKNIHILLYAINNLVKFEDINFKFSIYGDTLGLNSKAYFLELNDYIKSNKLEKYVFFKKGLNHKDLNSIYNNADLIISLSSTNSLDKVLLEAMSTGTLILTSNIAFRDILSKDKYCKDCFLNNLDPIYISKKIRKLLNSKNDRKSYITKLNIKFVKRHHSLKKLIKKLQKILKSL